ncbi:hypothetical protein M1271_01235 [Patescibacteria group bacterium]|nr:hypothetical protein [Patescibacteria group bacterium]MCL5797681.1 hypothetical protein [Patescibacteria group bacterium]
MASKNIRNVILHLLCFLAITALIYLPIKHQIDITPKNTFYPMVQGLFPDYYQYLSIINQGRTRMSYIDQYTLEKTSPTDIHIFYLTLGKFAALTGISDNIIVYHLSILFSLILFYLFSYRLISILVDGQYKWLAVFTVFFAGPFAGWYIKFAGQTIYTGTSWWNHTTVQERLYMTPHHFFASAMLLAAVYAFIRFVREKKLKYVLFCAFFQLIGLLVFSPPGFIFLSAVFLFTTLYLTILMRQKISGKKAKSGFGHIDDIRLLIKGTVVILFVSIAVLTLSYSLVIGTGLSQWEYSIYRAEIFPGTFWVYITSLGVLPFFAVFSLYPIRQKLGREQILILFLSILPLIFYIASVFGFFTINKMRFVYSAPYVFWGILAVWGIRWIVENVKNKPMKKAVFTIILIIILISTISDLYGYWVPQFSKLDTPNNIYIPDQNISAMQYLNMNAKAYSAVLAPDYIGNYLPAFTSDRVYVGHEVATMDFFPKQKKAYHFFNQDFKAEEAAEFIKNNGIEYVFSDRGDIFAEFSSFLKPVFQKGNVVLYKFYE